MSISAHTDYREYLQEELGKRTSANPSYSKRAFAKFLEIGTSTLCEVLQGRYNLSLDYAQKIALKLGMKPAEVDYFFLLVQFQATKNAEMRAHLFQKIQQQSKRKKIVPKDIDQFRVISEWYHLAVLALVDVERGRFCAATVSASLGISLRDADAAIQRLVRLGLLIAQGPTFTKSAEHIQFRSREANLALQKFMLAMLERTKNEIQEGSAAERITGTETLAFSAEQLPAAEKIIEDCFQKILALSEAGKSHTHVYHLGIHFFKLTKSNRGERNDIT